MRAYRAPFLFGLLVVLGAGGFYWQSKTRYGVAAKSRGGAAGKLASPKLPQAKGEQVYPLQRLVTEGFPVLTAEQLAAYVEGQRRSATSLLVAWHLGHDEALLYEAAEKAPDDPMVAEAMLIKHGTSAEAAEWIERLRLSEPDNALGPLYAARAALKAGSTEEAIAALTVLNTTPHLHLHTDQWQAALAKAYTSAGYAEPVADLASLFMTPMATGGMSEMGADLGKALASAAERGDRAQATALGELGMKAAATRGAGSRDILLNQMISFAMERNILNQMHSFDLLPGSQSQVVVERLSEMSRHIERLTKMMSTFGKVVATMTESELRQYTRRLQVEGELKAMEWLVAKRKAEER